MATKKLWVLERDGVSQGFMRLFRTCLEQTRLKYVEGWSASGSSLAVEFGSCVHWILAWIYTHENRKSKGRPEGWDFVQLTAEYHKVWKELNPFITKKAYEQQQFVYGLVECVMPRYCQVWAGDWPGGKDSFKHGVVSPVKWLSTEEDFNVPYEYPDGLMVGIHGFWDGIFEDKKKKLWLLETKTKSQIDEDALSDTLDLDIQVMLYLWTIREKLGRLPTGVLYNVIRRPGHRLGKTENLEDFFDRVAIDVMNPEKRDHYFKRWELRVSGKEIDKWKVEQLDPLMEHIRMWAEGRAPHYMNEEALVTKYGRCDLYEMIVRGTYSLYQRKRKAFSDLVDLRSV